MGELEPLATTVEQVQRLGREMLGSLNQVVRTQTSARGLDLDSVMLARGDAVLYFDQPGIGHFKATFSPLATERLEIMEVSSGRDSWYDLREHAPDSVNYQRLVDSSGPDALKLLEDAKATFDASGVRYGKIELYF